MKPAKESWQEIECRNCGTLTAATRKFCPVCGQRVTPKQDLTLVWIGLVLLAAAAASAFIDF